MKLHIVLFTLIGSLLSLTGSSNIVQDTLYINRGVFSANDTTSFPYLSFNGTPVFEVENKRIILQTNDTLHLIVINNDTTTHGFNIKRHPSVSHTIEPGNSTQVIYSSTVPITSIFYDNYNYPMNRYMGLAGMIIVTDNPTATNFFWNIKEHRSNLNDSISIGKTINWQEYYPNYFTINGKSNPGINTDAEARVVGVVGDTLHIYMVNTGQAVHSIHFHGYHCTILNSSKFPNHTGRVKDTFAIYSMESITLELIPHQPGEFPVHDHNLVAVSGGNIYPNGMFLTILIQ